MNEDLLITNLSKFSSQKNHPLNQGKGTYTRVEDSDGSDFPVLENRIEEIRQAVFMPVTELLKRTGVTYDHYRKLIRGEIRKPQTKTMIRFAKALGVTPPCDIFVFETDELRQIVHNAWSNLDPDKQTNLAEEVDDFKASPAKEVSLEYGLKVPSSFSEENSRIVVQRVYEFLEKKDGSVTNFRFNELTKSWINKVSKDLETDSNVLARVISEMLSEGD